MHEQMLACNEHLDPTHQRPTELVDICNLVDLEVRQIEVLCDVFSFDSPCFESFLPLKHCLIPPFIREDAMAPF